MRITGVPAVAVSIWLVLLCGCATRKASVLEKSVSAPEGAVAASPSAETNAVAAPREDSEASAVEGGNGGPAGHVPQLGPGLVLQISVLVSGKKEIDEPAKRISASGDLSLPLVGNVPVSGLSLQQLAERLTTLYAEYFVQPQVVVEFVQDRDSDMVSPWGYVTVLGKVKNPGRVSLPPTQDLTVSSAIQKAGGLDTSAKDTAIRVTRRLPDGQAERFDVNLRKVGARGRPQEDLNLKPGDVVFVPEMIF